MKFKCFLILSILILVTVNLAFSQSKKNTELNSLKEQVKVLEDKNSQLETKISIADNKIELLTKQIQLLEEQNELLKNNINLLNNNLNSLNNSTPKDDGRRYTIKFHAQEYLFNELNLSASKYNVSNFHYTWEGLMRGEGYYSGEMGFFKSIDEAMTMKSKLPKGINYEIIQINPK